MKRILIISIFLFSIGANALAINDFNGMVVKCDSLYQTGKYESIIKELVPAIEVIDNGKAKGTYKNITESNIVHARNLVADSYRMLGKYTHAAEWYWRTNEGYFDGYASTYLEILQRISVIKGRELNLKNLSSFKLLDNVPLLEKRKYFKDMIALNANRNVNLELEKYLAGEISLESLLQNVSKDNAIRFITYAGLNLEVSGDITKAHEMYSQVLSQKSDRIEALLAANRMGLLALKMIYAPVKGQGTILTDVIAVKASSAKLEDSRLYSVKNLIDGDPATTWVPAGKNSQIGEWVEFSFDDPMQVNNLVLTNGYAKSDASFSGNNRIKTAVLQFDDGKSSKVTLKDTPKPQIIPVRKKTRTIRITISEVYKGTKYDDTCLSNVELEFGK